jgi:hypothetical protein
MTAFPPTSRYQGIETTATTLPDGTVVVHLRRRFLPDPGRLATAGAHQVAAGERLDTIAAAALGDPTLFWRLCDANLAARPDDLEQPGRTLRIPLPGGAQ